MNVQRTIFVINEMKYVRIPEEVIGVYDSNQDIFLLFLILNFIFCSANTDVRELTAHMAIQSTPTVKSK